jgi:flagellin-like protein
MVLLYSGEYAFSMNSKAVSPIIGVILMVAITVILAGVIAAFVFSMAGSISQTKPVSCHSDCIKIKTSILTFTTVEKSFFLKYGGYIDEDGVFYSWDIFPEESFETINGHKVMFEYDPYSLTSGGYPRYIRTVKDYYYSIGSEEY